MSILARIYNSIYNLLPRLLLAILLDIVILIIFCYSYTAIQYSLSDYARDAEIQSIYKNLLVQTGQTQEALPLEIVDLPVDNAYNDGTKVVIYTGLISHTRSWDEIALVLGHEIAHGMLWHLHLPIEKLTDGQISTLEANADKMGAIYMIKAGYDICKGRELFKYWMETKGNALNQNHPSNAYRYTELNINCD
jgi:predicted Zn-dependent protease